MKVVLVDNYNRDNVSDTLLHENISKGSAETLAKIYNLSSTHRWAVVKDDSYQLYQWEP